jgi:hypothetical protein
MYLGSLYIYTKFWPDRISNMVARPAAILEMQQSFISLELMPGSSPNFYHRYINYWYMTLLHFFIWRTFEGHRGLVDQVNLFCYYLACKVLTLCERVSRHHFRFYQILAWSDLKCGHQVVILEKQLPVSAISPELMPALSKKFYHKYVKIWHNISLFMCPQGNILHPWGPETSNLVWTYLRDEHQLTILK